MDGPIPGEEEIRADFDQKRRDGLVFYDDKPKLQTCTLDGFQFEFAVTAAISKKPYIKSNTDEPSPQPSTSTTTTAATRPAEPERQRTGYAPGSDIDVSGYEIADVSATHKLCHNKFSMYSPHLLILTRDGHRRQYEPLDAEDVGAAWAVLERLGWGYFAFFNCGKDGGCSRLHKHLQIVPAAREGRMGPWPAASGGDGDEERRRGKAAPYAFYCARLDRGARRLSVEELTTLYLELLARARQKLRRQGYYDGRRDDAHVPHNLVLAQDWMLVIPRMRAGSEGAYGNALGMLGMVSVATEEELRCWTEQGPRRVLERLGCPKDDDDDDDLVE